MRNFLAIVPLCVILSGCSTTSHTQAVSDANKQQTESAAAILALRETNKKPIAETTVIIPEGFVNNSGGDIEVNTVVWAQDEMLYLEAIQLAKYEMFDPLWLRVMDRLIAPVTAGTLYYLGREYDYKTAKLSYGQQRYESERQWNFMDQVVAPAPEEEAIEVDGIEGEEIIIP